MSSKKRQYFDDQVDWVLKRLPDQVTRLMEDVPLCVEDLPSRKIMGEMGISHPSELCGCFVGYSIENRNSQSHTTPTMIMIYRLGITEKAFEEAGKDDIEELRRQIRITILHEYAHYIGMDEDELDALGYG